VIPSHPVALALLRAVGRPIAAPSANRFTHVSPTTAAHVLASLGDRAPLILDGGPSEVGIESTVVDLTGDTPRILRPGMLSRAQLVDALGGPVDIADTTVRVDDAQTTSQLAPGAGDRHYAPRADVWLFAPNDRAELVHALAVWRAAQMTGRAAPVTALLRSTALALTAADHPIAMPDEPAAYARTLYAALHTADANGSALVVIERPPEAEEWRGVRDRLARAAR
jgi:L-threonylcarbamoyladenylate synthase